MAGGILVYFAAPEEPGGVGPATMVAVCAVSAWVTSARRSLFVVFLLATCASAGFLAAKLRTLSVQAPQLSRPLIGTVRGVVLSVDLLARGGARFVMRPVTIEGLASPGLPHRIRLTTQNAEGLLAGSAITVKASLRPPSPPAVPGGYDFARDAFFEGVGGVGFTLGRPRAADRSIDLTLWERASVVLDAVRNALTDRITRMIPGENGAVAASQVTGKRGLIPQEANEALRASGLYHVVSISGLHMALFAGGLFWLIRMALAASMRLALTWPLKGAAAVLALIPAAAYTVFSGAEVATVRAFLMTAIVLIAVALERTAITRRNVALAATFVLATTPEALVGPSFQMSFAAVTMLVAWYDRPRRRARRTAAALFERGLSRLAVIALGLLVTTLIASLATAPFSAFHFHRLTLQSLAANLLAAPIISGLIMPLALMALVAEPFGYAAPLWAAMGTTVGWFLDIARLVAGWPGSEIIVPQLPASTLLAFAVALVILAILRTRLALAALLPLAAGFALAAFVERPVALIGAAGHAALIRDRETISIIANKRDGFLVKAWLLAMGDARSPGDASLASRVRCDGEGCSAPLGPGLALFVDRTANAVDEDCGSVAVLVSPLDIPPRCAETGLAVDGQKLAAAGSIALFAEKSKDGGHTWRMTTARQATFSRPWAVPTMAGKPATMPEPAPGRGDDDQ
jgi:competence protein ComEC